MSGYVAPPAGELPAPLTAEDIDKLFRRAPGWFARDRVRKRLYALGFPHPFQPGQWSPGAVRAWLESDVGRNPECLPPNVDKPRRRRPRRSASRSGYAEP